MKILIDDREPSKIIDKAKKTWKDVEVAHLPVGDIVCLENNVAIERKEVSDFASSVRAKKGMSTGRIFSQVAQMKENFTNNYVIIVGKFDKVSKNPHFKFTVDQFIGAQASIAARQGVPVFHVANNSQFFKLCSALIRKSNGEEKDLSNVVRSQPVFGDIIASIIGQVPGVGPKKALAIKEHFNFDKVSDICELSEDDLKQVNGIGFVQSQNIKKYFF